VEFFSNAGGLTSKIDVSSVVDVNFSSMMLDAGNVDIDTLKDHTKGHMD
jgi:hypothetical protein